MKNLLRKILGDRGERAAVRFLKSQGFRILERGHRNVGGEIDIVALDGPQIVFVEVKTRSGSDRGKPFEAVDLRKQQKLTRAALVWLKENRRLSQSARFDVISIEWPDESSTPTILHFRHAFEATGNDGFFG